MKAEEEGETSKWVLAMDEKRGILDPKTQEPTGLNVLKSKDEKYALAFQPYCVYHGHTLHTECCPKADAMARRRREAKCRREAEQASQADRRRKAYAEVSRPDANMRF